MKKTAALALGLALLGCQPSTEEMTAQGRKLLQEGELEEAANWLQRSLAADSTQYAAWLALGAAQFEQGQLQPAQKAFQRALMLRRKDYRPWYNLGNVFRESQQDSLALLHYTEAAVLQANVADIYVNRAFVLERMGLAERALQDYQLALNLQPTAPVYVNHAKVALTLGQDSLALISLQQARKEPSLLPDVAYLQALAHWQGGAEQLACRSMQEAADRQHPGAGEWLEKNCAP